MGKVYLIGARIDKKNGKYAVLHDMTIAPDESFYLLRYIAPFVRIGTLKSRRTKSGKIRAFWRRSLPPILSRKLEELGFEFIKTEGLAEFSADEFSEIMGYIQLRRKRYRKRR